MRWITVGLAVLLAIAVGLAVGTGWLSQGLGPSAIRARAIEEKLAAVRAADAAAAAMAAAERAAIHAASESSPGRPGAPGAESDPRLTGVVLDPAGGPIADAAVTVFRREGSEYELLDRAHNRERRRVGDDATDAEGRFAVDVPPERPHLVRVDAPGYAPLELARRYAGEFVVAHLEPASVLHGFVTRAEDGTPVDGASLEVRVRADAEHAGRNELWTGETDANGRYRCELSPVPIELVVRTSDTASAWIELDLEPGATVRQDVALDAGDTVSGRVIDAVSELPIAGAEVGPSWGGSTKRAVTGPDGRFELLGFSSREADLRARAPGYGALERRVRPARGAELRDGVLFALYPARVVRGRIVGPDGVGIEGAYVAAAASDYLGKPRHQRTDWRSGRSGEDGRFELDGVRADMRHVLFAKHDGFGAVTYDLTEEPDADGVFDVGTVTLPLAATIRGVVVDENGEGIPGLQVKLTGTNEDRERLSGQPMPNAQYVDWYVAAKVARTDDRGRFAFTDLSAGRRELRANLPGAHTFSREVIEVPVGGLVEGIRLEVIRGLAISGRIVVSDGGPTPKVYVSVDPEGGGRASDVECDAKGNFAATGLSQGTYSLTAYPYPTEEDERADRKFASATVRGVAAGRANVEVRLTRRAWVRGSVRDADRRSIEGAYVVALDPGGEPVGADKTEADGRFEIEVAEGTRIELVARPPKVEGESERDVWKPAMWDRDTIARVVGIEAGALPGVEIELPWSPGTGADDDH